jgi:hypothetical protein
VRVFPNDCLTAETSASLIGRLGSSAFRPSRPFSSPYSYIQDRRPIVSSLCKTSGSYHPRIPEKALTLSGKALHLADGRLSEAPRDGAAVGSGFTSAPEGEAEAETSLGAEYS